MRPVEHLNDIEGRYPNAWKLVDKFRRDRGKTLPNWPEWCFLPMSGWYAIVSDVGDKLTVPFDRALDIGRLAALGTWRYSQGVYRFDSNIFDTLWKTPITGNLPTNMFLRLPEWCLYIEIPGQKNMHGFWVHLESDTKDHRKELRLLMDLDDGLMPMPIHIGDWPLETAIKKAIVESYHHIPMKTTMEVPGKDIMKAFSESMAPMVSLVLYLCSEKPDFGKPTRPGVKKHGSRLFPAKGPTIWHIGDEKRKNH